MSRHRTRTVGRDHERPSHGMYGSRWKRLRDAHLAQFPLCALCGAQKRLTAATVVDHIVPHRGDPALFWDVHNLRSLCTRHHSGSASTKDRLGYHTDIGPDGLPVDPAHPFNAKG